MLSFGRDANLAEGVWKGRISRAFALRLLAEERAEERRQALDRKYDDIVHRVRDHEALTGKPFRYGEFDTLKWVGQPRLPSGSVGAGEFTFGRESEGIPAEVPAGYMDTEPGKHSVVLEDEEKNGGHTIRRHVGRTATNLVGAMLLINQGLAKVGKIHPTEGSFTDVRTANDLVNRVLANNGPAIDDVISGKSDRAILKQRFGFPTGQEAHQPDVDTLPYIRNTYNVRVIILPDPRRAQGFKILTAYPANEYPNEVE